MSFREKYTDFKERILKPALIPMIKADLLFFSGGILELMSESHLKRRSLPEPFDVASHIGNFREGAMGTVGAYALIGIPYLFPAYLDENREGFKKRAKLTAVGAFAVSSAIQIIGEKYGLTNNLVAPNTPDMLDAAYGIAWSGVAAGASYKLLMGVEASLHERREERRDAREVLLQ